MGIEEILTYFADFVAALAAILASIYSFSQKFRTWVNRKLKDPDSIKNLTKKQDELQKKHEELQGYYETKGKEFENMFTKMDRVIDKIDKKLDKDADSAILTLKCEILDICNRANRYKGITASDKSLLCELYHQYVDVWKENHYVKSEADKVIKNFPILDEYKR